MAVSPVEDYVASLLEQRVAEAKTGGVQNASVEAVAVFNSVALNLLLKPRCALLFALLARNGLQKTVQAEIGSLEELKTAIQDLGNVAFQIKDASSLRRARAALLQLERLPSVSATNPTLKLYQTSVRAFLDSQLAKNVRRSGANDLTRSAAEARTDLVGTLATLKEQHADLLDRLYSLMVGVDNFAAAPFAALIGTSAAARARADIESIITAVEASGDPSPARDFVLRLISGQATLSSLASPPAIMEPLFDGMASSAAAPAQMTSAVGPFVPAGLSPSFSATVKTSPTDVGITESFSFFESEAAILVSSPISFPLTIPAGYGLFFVIDGVAQRVPIDGTFASVAALFGAFNATIGYAHSTQFAYDPTRWVIYFPGASQVSVATVYQYPTPDPSTTTGVPSTTALSAHALCGFEAGQLGEQNVSAQVAADYINSRFTIISARATTAGTVELTTASTVAGTELLVSAPSSFGLVGPVSALSDSVSLAGVADHRDLVQPGDQVSLGGVTQEVGEVSQSSLTLLAPAPTYSGPAIVTSALALAYQALIANVKMFFSSWQHLPYTTDLTTVDRALAPLGASSAPGQRNMALAEVQRLESALVSLLNLLSAPSTMLPDGAALNETQIVEGILTTLEERHYDRAVDLLLKCNLQSLLEMDADQASYGGSFLKAASTFAQANISQEPEAPGTTSAVSAGRS